MRVSRRDLEVGDRLGAGSQGVIYRVRGGSRFGLATDSLIYKEFSAGTSVSGAALEHLSLLRDGLDDPGRRLLDAMTVWPLAVVDEDGRTTGYLMQEIPQSFLQRIETMAGPETIPREVQHLFVSDDLATRTLGEVPTRLERMALARELAFVLGFLHGKQLIFGDLSYKNTVYALRPKPSVMLLDCDAVRARGQGSAVAQLHSPGWAPPEKGPQTIATDRYKLGLFVLRVLTPGVNAQNRDPAKAKGVLDAAGVALLERALALDPAERTSGREWVEYFDARIASSGGVPTRSGWVPKPAPPARLARPGELVSPRGRPASAVATRRVVAPVPRSATVGAPAPPTVHPRLQGATPSPSPPGPGTGSPWRGPTGVRWPASTSTTPNKLAHNSGIIIWGIVAGVVLYGLISVILNGRSTPTGPVTRDGTGSSGTIVGVLPVGRPGASASTAVAASLALAPAGSVPVAVSTNGSARPSTAAPDATPLTDVPATWVVETVPGDALAADSATVSSFVVKDGVAGEPELSVVTGRRFVALPDDLATRLDRAVGTAAGLVGHSVPVSMRWTCPSATSAVNDCRWQFTVPGNAPVFVSADGRVVTAAPSWAS